MKKFVLSLVAGVAVAGLLTGCAADSAPVTPVDKGDANVAPKVIDTVALTEFYDVMKASCDKAREVGVAVDRDWGGALYEPTGRGIIYYGTLGAVDQSSSLMVLEDMHEGVMVCEDAAKWVTEVKPHLADIESGTAYEDATGEMSKWTLAPVKVSETEWVLHPTDNDADTTYDAHYYLEDGVVVRSVYGGTVDVEVAYRYGALTADEKKVVDASPVGMNGN